MGLSATIVLKYRDCTIFLYVSLEAIKHLVQQLKRFTI